MGYVSEHVRCAQSAYHPPQAQRPPNVTHQGPGAAEQEQDHYSTMHMRHKLHTAALSRLTHAQQLQVQEGPQPASEYRCMQGGARLCHNNSLACRLSSSPAVPSLIELLPPQHTAQ